MGKMWKTRTLDCSREFAWNAREVLSVRVAEVYAHLHALEDPSDGVGHHDLRISIKRLRYSLEFFAICFDPEDVAVVLSALSTLQDLLGDLHDAEVLIPDLQHKLGELVEHRASVVRRVREGRSKRKEPMTLEAFKTQLSRGADLKARPGIVALINRLRRQRQSSYRGAGALWHRLETEGFRERLSRFCLDTIAERVS